MARGATDRKDAPPAAQCLYVAFELAAAKWQLAASDGGPRILEHAIVPGDDQGLVDWMEKARVVLGLPEGAPVKSCHEAGRDGFWVHRFLERLEIRNVVVDPASIKVDRRRRRRKTDRLDARRLLTDLVRHHNRERDVWSTCVPPSAGEEDNRRLHRELERLKKERAQHRMRILSLLATQGVRPKSLCKALKDLGSLRGWDASPLPPALGAEIERESNRLSVAADQIRVIQKEQQLRVEAAATPDLKKVRILATLDGIGLDSAWLLAMEFFAWRTFANRREVAAAVGLAGTPHNTGQSEREKGISKAGNRRVRTRMIELAWLWLRHQPHSRLTRWFAERFAKGGVRMRRIGIVAVARRLLVELWHFVEDGVVPPGAKVRLPA